MDDRYAEAIVDELERIADLLEDFLNIEVAKLKKANLTEYLPERIRRRPDEKRAVKVRSGATREQL